MSDITPHDVLFQGEKPLPALPAVDHYAGSEKLMRKALQLQQEMGPVFDITCDCEDGARAGAETEHAHMVVEMVNGADNRFGRVGARIHDITHLHWRNDLEILIRGAGNTLAFITVPKVTSVQDAMTQMAALRAIEQECDVARPLPVHILIETHGALKDVWQLASLPGVESLDFGLMDFVSAHQGAIPASAMQSPQQFEHPLIVRAKTEISAAALANGVIPSHNVTTELQSIEYIHNDALRARNEFGYLRMWSIHPKQIAPIIQAMQPDLSEVETAAAILLQAQGNQWGPISYAGKLHDRASYRYYWTLLQRAHATGMSIPTECQAWFTPQG
jgi:citrate lyase subunit beta/citryl-CoA lyase